MSDSPTWRLSKAQTGQLLWARTRPPGSYTMVQAWRIHGPLHLDVLDQAVGDVVARHDSLRCVLGSDDGQSAREAPGRAWMRVQSRLAQGLRIVDLRGEPADERGRIATALIDAERFYPFNIEGEDLIRFHAIVFGDEEHLLLVSVEHLLWDHLSPAIFLADLAALHEWRAGRSELDLRPIPSAVEMVERREDESDDPVTTAFWEERLLGASPMPFPTERPWPDQPTYTSAPALVALDRDAYAALVALAAEERATPYMALLSVLGAWAAALSGRGDVCWTFNASDRLTPQAMGMIGNLTKLLYLRLDVDAASSPRELIRQARTQVLGALRHANTHYLPILGGLENRMAVMGGEPLAEPRPGYESFQDFFLDGGAGVRLLTDFISFVPKGGGPATTAVSWQAEPVEPIGPAHLGFDMVISFVDVGSDILISVRYGTDRMDPGAMEERIASWSAMLASFGSDPDGPIPALPVAGNAVSVP